MFLEPCSNTVFLQACSLHRSTDISRLCWTPPRNGIAASLRFVSMTKYLMSNFGLYCAIAGRGSTNSGIGWTCWRLGDKGKTEKLASIFNKVAFRANFVGGDTRTLYLFCLEPPIGTTDSGDTENEWKLTPQRFSELNNRGVPSSCRVHAGWDQRLSKI